MVPGLVIVFILYLISGSGPLAIGLAVAWLIFVDVYNRNHYAKEWICSKCGSIFDPERTSSASVMNGEHEYSAKAAELVRNIYELIPMVTSNTSLEERQRCARQIEDLLQEIEDMGESSVVTNFDEAKAKIKVVINSSSALPMLDKYDVAHEKGAVSDEIKYLKTAQALLEVNEISVKEFNSLQAMSEKTGRRWTMSSIEKNLAEALSRSMGKKSF